MATTQTTATRRRKTVAETNGKVKAITVRKVRLVLPSKVPFGSMRGLLKDDGTVGDVVGFLEAVLGEEQMEKVWAIDLDLSKGSLLDQTREVLDELADKVAGELGLALGE
jgi:hypothetical protein